MNVWPYEEKKSIAPTYVQAWVEFLEKVEVRGAIPIRFEVVASSNDARRPLTWAIRSIAQVLERDRGTEIEVIMQRMLTPLDVSKDHMYLMLQQIVYKHYTHEAAESVYVDEERVFDPHRDRVMVPDEMARKLWP